MLIARAPNDGRYNCACHHLDIDHHKYLNTITTETKQKCTHDVMLTSREKKKKKKSISGKTISKSENAAMVNFWRLRQTD